MAAADVDDADEVDEEFGATEGEEDLVDEVGVTVGKQEEAGQEPEHELAAT